MEIKVKEKINLAKFTTYNAGGSARYFGHAENWQHMFALREFAKYKKLPFFVLGCGSNVLFSDKGYSGVVAFNQMKQVRFNKNSVIVEGGVNLNQLVLTAAQHNFGGLSGLASIPGSIGGAIYGNAGIPDMWIGNFVQQVIILPENGKKPVTVTHDYCKFDYRTSIFKKNKDIILAVKLKLIPMPSVLVKSEIAKIIKARMLKQPVGLSCGSFFKNPGQFPSAGWLIEQAGCRGMKCGGAKVSDKHANFIMNTGEATASDIINLAKKVHTKVSEKYNIELEPEVQIFPGESFKF